MNKYRITFLIFFIINLQLFSQNNEFFESKITFSGYGELHFNQEQSPKGYISKSLDFHRFVTFIGYNWTEKWSFKSEIELEHNFVQDGQGELELEQAYVNYWFSSWSGSTFDRTN